MLAAGRVQNACRCRTEHLNDVRVLNIIKALQDGGGCGSVGQCLDTRSFKTNGSNFVGREIRKSIRDVHIRETRYGGAHGPVECAPHIPRVSFSLLYAPHSRADAHTVVQGVHRIPAILAYGTVSCRGG